jgi:hypothetical protein
LSSFATANAIPKGYGGKWSGGIPLSRPSPRHFFHDAVKRTVAFIRANRIDQARR